ncbi:MAG: type I methionyl aminopeptidase [Dehalococcoidia bacterium]|nr:type I methionyl aminopeptidase [Dehalococcoidia bacterium]
MRVIQPRIQSTGVIVKSPGEIEVMRQAGKVVAQTVRALLAAVRSGMTTAELDAIAEATIRGAGATPSFKGYRGFPASICTSLNEQVVHGIPGRRVIKDGDIVSLDVGAIVDGFHGDSAVTVCIGHVTPQAKALVDAGEASLNAGIRMMRAGNRMGDVSWAAQQAAESQGFSVVREYVGHGIGRQLHEEPAVPNFGAPGRGLLLQPGMVLAIEPMVNAGTWATKVLDDGWTVVTQDGSWSSHWEHTVAILESGPEILTAR